MIVPIPRSARPSEENVLPLINIVFLLLIFFMIAGALSSTAPFEIEPPPAAAADATQAPRGGVAIAADGRMAFDGERIGPEALADRAREWRERRDAEQPLPVRADADAPTRRLTEALEALREAGVERIRLLAVSETRDG